MDKPVIVLGAGGHGKVILDMLGVRRHKVLGITDTDVRKHGREIQNVLVIGDDVSILQWNPEDIFLANGIGSIADTAFRYKVYNFFSDKGYEFISLVHPGAIIAKDVILGKGVQIMAGAIVQPSCSIGDNSIINSGAIIEHDCKIAEHVHIAPGCVLSGGVAIGANSHIGTGAVLIQGIHVGKECLIGAGAVVVKDVSDGQTVMGVPARAVDY